MLGLGDSLFFHGGRHTIYAFDSLGQSLPGWPVDVLLEEGADATNTFFSKDAEIDEVGTVFAGVGVDDLAAVVALNPDGSEAWRNEYSVPFMTGVLGPSGTYYVGIGDAPSGGGFRYAGLAHDSGLEVCSTEYFTPATNGLAGTPDALFVSSGPDLIKVTTDCRASSIYTTDLVWVKVLGADGTTAIIMEYNNGVPHLISRLAGIKNNGTGLWRAEEIFLDYPEPILAVRNGVVYLRGQDIADSNKLKMFLIDIESGQVLNSLDAEGLCLDCGVAVTADNTVYVVEVRAVAPYYRITRLN